MEEKPEIDLDRFRQHKRRIPWGLIRKIIIGTATISLLLYFINQMKKADEAQNKKEFPTEVEVDVEP